MTRTAQYNANATGNHKLASIAPWISRFFMIPPTLIMVLIGMRYIQDPMHAASSTGVVLTSPEAWTDTRVVGALALTVAFSIASSLISRRRLHIGHLIVITLMATFLALRFFGFAHDGTTLAMGDLKVKTIGESVFLVLNAFGFFLQQRTIQRPREEL